MRSNLFKSAALVAALAITMSGCSNEEPANGNETAPKEGTLVTASMPATGPDTRLVHELAGDDLSVKWKASTGGAQEQFYGLILDGNDDVYGGRFDQVADMPSGKSTDFRYQLYYLGSFFPAAMVENEKYYVIYSPQDLTQFQVDGSTTKSYTIPYSLTYQDGTITSIEKFNLMTANAVMTEEIAADESFSFQFKHRIAVMRLKGLQGFDLTATEATKVSISGTGLCNAATLAIDFDNFDTTGGITLGGDAAIEVSGTFAITNGVMDDVYICFFPGNADATGTHQITDLKVTATVGSDTYEYSYGADAAVANKVEKFAEGKMYTLKDKTMTKQAPEITWAAGNLVADGPNGAKIGTATDGGLYFQFGSLVGWAGGASGDGTGRGTDDIIPTRSIVVSPVGCTVTSWDKDWLGDPATDDAVSGKGDPCRYYLKGTWRLPTNDEYKALFNNVTDGEYANSGGWSWDATSKSATNNTKNLTFPASGYRDYLDGSLNLVGTDGYYWSASPYFARDGYALYFGSSDVSPSNYNNRAGGLPVRCVQ